MTGYQNLTLTFKPIQKTGCECFLAYEPEHGLCATTYKHPLDVKDRYSFCVYDELNDYRVNIMETGGTPMFTIYFKGHETVNCTDIAERDKALLYRVINFLERGLLPHMGNLAKLSPREEYDKTVYLIASLVVLAQVDVIRRKI